MFCLQVSNPPAPEQTLSRITVTPRFPNPSVVKAPPTNPNKAPIDNRASGKFPNLKANRGQDNPVVYRREKLKLRATISPAILEHLQKTSQDESTNRQGGGITNQGGAVASSSNNPSCNTPDVPLKKGITWHQKQVESTQQNNVECKFSGFGVCGKVIVNAVGTLALFPNSYSKQTKIVVW